ncbi:histone-like nucleoid-structuring protein Lsr2 [Actinomadura sp. 3N508]|uniref:Lsr2 family DNA-binding protein n=1 Tax=Actinomadura sp. 3N508 TaxID=3375153 RepID=UPI0037998A76
MADEAAAIPPVSSGWATATGEAIFIRVAQWVREQIVRFELWDGEPPPPPDDDLPETEETHTITVPTGKLAFNGRRGLVRNVFTVRPGRYHVRVAGRHRELAARGGDFGGLENYTVQLWPETVDNASGLVAATQRVAMTGYGVFAFYDDGGDTPEPEISDGWFSATRGGVEIRPMCQLPEPGMRFELWSDAPPPDVTDAGDEPEVQARLSFLVTRGSIGMEGIATGAEPDVFELPPGWYHVHLLGYRRSVMPAIEKDLYARDIAPGDEEWERAEGIELYVARFWPDQEAEAERRHAAAAERPPERDERLEAIRAWAKVRGMKVNDSGPLPAAIIAMYEASH